MMMKRVTLGFSILAASAVFILGCKPTKNTEPVADTEVQSAVRASFMNYVVSDVDMVCSFLGENTLLNTFYSAYPGVTQTVTAVRDTNGSVQDQLVMSWNSTKCRDGNVRDGSIFMYVPQKANQRYSRNYGWQGEIVFYNYKVNGWIVENADSNVHAYLYNTLPTSSFVPTSTKITWKFGGKLRFRHPTDPNQDMIWQGELHKTLDNTSDPKVYPPSGQAAINWSLAVVKYDGTVQGSVPQIDAAGTVTPNVHYNMYINTVQPLVRDFQCSPNQVTGVAFTPTGTLTERGDDHHPFKAGVASFTVGSAYPRQIYYGNEGEPNLPLQCDNTGEVMIKGISYRIDFMQ